MSQKLVARAKKAVSVVKDPELRQIAFQLVLDDLTKPRGKKRRSITSTRKSSVI